MARLARPVVLTCLATVVGCHLIGGVSDLEYSDPASGGAGTGTGSGAPGGGEVGGGGSGGMACDIVPCEAPCCVDCAPAAAGADCDPGICDGSGFCAVGELGTATIYGGDERDEASGAVALSDGRLFVAGHTLEGADLPFGDGVTLASGATSSFLTGFDATGMPTWTWRLAAMPTSGDRRLRAMAVTENDHVVVGGGFSQHVALVTNVFTGNTFISKTTSGDSDEDAFVGLVDPEGNGQWLWSSGGAANQTIVDVAVLGDYVVAVGTTGPGTFNFGGKVIGDTAVNDDSGFVLVFDAATGDPVDGASWSCMFATATGVATTPSGGIWVVGTYSGDGCIVFDDQLTWSDAGTYPYVARLELDTSGATPSLHVPGSAVVKVESYGGVEKANVQAPLRVTDSGDGVVIAGEFRNQASNGIDFGDGQVVSSLSFRPFVVGFDDGGADWIRLVAGDGDVTINDLVSDAAGNILLVGDLENNGTITMSPFIYDPSNGGEDGFIIKLSRADEGDLLWGLGSSTADEDHLTGVAVSPTALWAVGWGLDLQMWNAPAFQPVTDYNLVMLSITP